LGRQIGAVKQKGNSGGEHLYLIFVRRKRMGCKRFRQDSYKHSTLKRGKKKEREREDLFKRNLQRKLEIWWTQKKGG